MAQHVRMGGPQNQVQRVRLGRHHLGQGTDGGFQPLAAPHQPESQHQRALTHLKAALLRGAVQGNLRHAVMDQVQLGAWHALAAQDINGPAAHDHHRRRQRT